ncbi:L-seryl-tRNA(Sec) kinase [Bombina bombina]|uniref:L-seryl-tRNA(Sec) kinase n=1 Tax=Bombina bombina TaxID=8345 RepID=UPI00235AE275|nr:L-seryl-tRNA(Sec) kinase [Bombina bombina]
MSASEQTRRLVLCLLCGLPGTGKSSIAEKLSKTKCSWSVVVITYDDIITAEAFLGITKEPHRKPREISASEDRQTSLWKQHRRHLLGYVEKLITSLLNCPALEAPACSTEGSWNQFLHCLNLQGILSPTASDMETTHHYVNIPEGCNVCLLLDDNFYYQSMRYEVYQLARKYSLGFCQIYLHCPLEFCLQRNKTRPYPLPDKTIHLMEEKMEKPNADKNPWENNSLSLDTSVQVPIEKITDLLLNAMENPLSPVQEDCTEKDKERAICAASIIHQADLSLRRIISDQMKTLKGKVSPQHIKAVAQDLQHTKSKLIEDLRQSMSGTTSLSHNKDTVSDIVCLFEEHSKYILQPYLRKELVDVQAQENQEYKL